MELEAKQLQEMQEISRELSASLLADLRCVTGSDENFEWMLMFHKHPVAITPPPHLLYAKFIILSPEGRRLAQYGQAAILAKCNIYRGDTSWLTAALAYAMALWDDEHQA